jgi:hypothetical protein
MKNLGRIQILFYYLKIGILIDFKLENCLKLETVTDL